jgi:hypothetical protein
MTILIHFHQSQYRHFKASYLSQVLPHRKSEFPNLVSYTPEFGITTQGSSYLRSHR